MIAKTFMFGCGGTFLDAHGGSAATVKRVAASAPAGAACEEQRLQFARQLGGAVFYMACKEADISYIGEKTEKDKKTEKGEPKKKKAKVVQAKKKAKAKESRVESLLCWPEHFRVAVSAG